MNQMSYGLNVNLTLDRGCGVSLREQILAQLKSAITEGVLPPGDPLPSSRSLAERLRVSRTTVLACYQELEGDGWIYGAHGSGTFVARRDANPPTSLSESMETDAPPRFTYDFRPGAVDPALAIESGWKNLWRNFAPSEVPAPACGTSELRSAIATYLSSARGLRCSPGEIIVCAGTAEAITVLSLALGWAGSSAAVEDPGYPVIRDILRRMSVQCRPLDVTDPATIPAQLDSAETLSAVYLTPSHQYPLGHRLSVDVRSAVLAWSDRTGAVVIEDDYDGEFHFGVAPSTSMAGMRTSANVAYIGTMSKVLDPGLRLAYLRVPPHLAGDVRKAREDLGSTVAAPVQDGVAALIRSGQLSRHIARVRRVYGDRRRVLLHALDGVPGVRRLTGIDAGLHIVAELSAGIDAAKVVSEAGERGIGVLDLDGFRTRPEPDRPALVLGYARHTPSAARAAMTLFAQCPALHTHEP
jgi:GntR family transcriptional regulator/MocR family aminotransferase